MRSLPRFLFALFLAAGCSEDPSSVGVGLLPPSDLPVFIVDTLIAGTVSTSKAIPITQRQDPDFFAWNPEHLFVGGVQTLVSGSFVRFEKVPDSLLGVVVTAADLILTPTVAFGDTTLDPVFTYHRALNRWFSDSLSVDSLTQQPGTYFDPAPLPAGSGTGTVDTGGVVSFPLDTAQVRQWFITNVDSGTTNLGIYLRGTANGVIQGYGAFANLSEGLRPRLRVAYVKNGVPGTAMLTSGSSRYLADLPQANLILDPNSMYVQAGVSYRGMVTFDISALPRPVSVSESILELTLDSAASDRSGGPDSLVAFYIETGDRTEKLSAVIGARKTVNSRPVYAFAIPLYVQQWMRTNTQARVVIGAYRENSSFQRFTVHGHAAAADLRPRLIMTYSKAIATRGGRP